MKTKIFYINLDSMPLRRQFMESQFTRLNVLAHRQQAVDGTNISADHAKDYEHSPAWRKLTPGEIGCFLSHREIWKKIVQQEITHAIICEDDIHIGGSFHSIIQSLEEINESIGLIRLDTNFYKSWYGSEIMSIGEHKIRPIQSFSTPGTGAYRLNYRVGYQLQLLNNSVKFLRELDSFLYHRQKTSIQAYQLWPAICCQDIILTTHRKNVDRKNIHAANIETSKIESERLIKFKHISKGKKILREFKRIYIKIKSKVQVFTIYFDRKKFISCPLKL